MQCIAFHPGSFKWLVSMVAPSAVISWGTLWGYHGFTRPQFLTCEFTWNPQRPYKPHYKPSQKPAVPANKLAIIWLFCLATNANILTRCLLVWSDGLSTVTAGAIASSRYWDILTPLWVTGQSCAAHPDCHLKVSYLGRIFWACLATSCI